MELSQDPNLPECSDPEHGAHEHQPHTPRVVEGAARMCAAMGDPSRLRLLELLWDRRHCVSELAKETEDSMSAISQRLKILYNAGLVARQRSGKHVFYSLADNHVRELLNQLFLHASE